MTKDESRAKLPRAGGRPIKYKFDSLKVGGKTSIKIESSSHVQSVRLAAWKIAKTTGMKFATRTIGDLIVVWRVK